MNKAFSIAIKPRERTDHDKGAFIEPVIGSEYHICPWAGAANAASDCAKQMIKFTEASRK